MGMVVQHNISALNANNAMTRNVSGLSKSTEKLSTGYQINRAADNAAGLAISEKMRSQIRGLSQATNNANDAISLIQTAEGGLQETEDILQRMRELSVQSANGTYTDEDREQIQFEVDALKAEVDRIAESTEFNEMKLLDGNLGGGENATEYGAVYGMKEKNANLNANITVTSDVQGAQVAFTTGASGKGGENAVWDASGKKVTLNLVAGKNYTDKEIQDLIDNATMPKDAGMTASAANIKYSTENGLTTAANGEETTATVSGARGNITVDAKTLVADATNGGIGSSDTIKFTANSYGDSQFDESLFAKIAIATDVAAGKEEVTTDKATVIGTSGAEVTLHLATGVEYTEEDIEKLFTKAGYDYDVSLTDELSPDGNKDGVIKFNVSGSISSTALDVEGAGVGKNFIGATGEGLTFQIGANGVEDQRLTVNIDDMGASALGVGDISVAKQDDANTAINKIDDAIKTVSTQRAKLGAVQNRLEHTVNSLSTAGENLTSAESQIRDTDMASEMIKYTKSNILQQASQSMLAQANQQPQGVLQLLG
ncbi:MAG: flagellin [Ruminiclostridium sp.]